MISVALCTYNGEKYIKDQLLSIIYQSKKVDEIIICDDGSNDRTLEVIEQIQKGCPIPIKVFINNPSKGVTNNFFFAINQCSGDIIFLSDQDDVWMSDKVNTLYKYLEHNTSIDVVFTDAQLIDENGQTLFGDKTLWSYFFPPNSRKRCSQGMAAEEFCRGNHVTGATMAFRKTFVTDIKPLDNYLHDEIIATIAAARHTLGYIDSCLIKYRIHRGQQIGIGKDSRRYTTNEEDYRSPDLPDDRLLHFFRDKTDIQRINFYIFRHNAIHSLTGPITILAHINKYSVFYKKSACIFWTFDIRESVRNTITKICSKANLRRQ